MKKEQDRTRLKLVINDNRFEIHRGGYVKKAKGYGWAPVSVHYDLGSALGYAIQHVIMHGYPSKGLAALKDHVDSSVLLVKAWIRDLHQDMKAELEITDGTRRKDGKGGPAGAGIQDANHEPRAMGRLTFRDRSAGEKQGGGS